MKFYTRQRRLPTVIIVSLIDILAILLIFVIVTTTFKSPQPEVVIKLPESATASNAANRSNPVVLGITKGGDLFLDDKPQTLEELKATLLALMKQNPDKPVAVKADTEAPFGQVIKVMDALKQAGVKNVPALTQTPK